MIKFDIVSSLSKLDSLYINNDILINDKKDIEVLGLSSYDRPLYLSELDKILKNREYHVVSRKLISDNKLYLVKDEFSNTTSNLGEDEYYNYNDYINNSMLINDVKIEDDFDSKIISGNITIGDEYKNIIEKEAGMTLYSTSKIIIDILDGSISLNLVEPDEYTNTISLIDVKKKVAQVGLSGKIDLTVDYTIDGIIYGKDLTFEAFSYNGASQDNPVLVESDFVSSYDYFDIEYINGIIRVIPKSDKIDECIISNCMLTYGCI